MCKLDHVQSLQLVTPFRTLFLSATTHNVTHNHNLIGEYKTRKSSYNSVVAMKISITHKSFIHEPVSQWKEKRICKIYHVQSLSLYSTFRYFDITATTRNVTHNNEMNNEYKTPISVYFTIASLRWVSHEKFRSQASELTKWETQSNTRSCSHTSTVHFLS
jgi:hypothetical protein